MTQQNSTTHHSPLTTHGARRRASSSPHIPQTEFPIPHSPFPIPHSAHRLPPTAHRRGVLLLVVLILLVMFVMMAVTYVLVATRQLSISKAMSLKDATGDPPSQVLDGVMMQLVRDTTNKHSVLYSQSLLEHMYGPYTAVGSVVSSNIASFANNQIVEFNGATLSANDPNFTLNSSLQNMDGYLEGCVITMTSGPAKGLTSRIVRYQVTPSGPVYHVLAFKGTAGPISPAETDTTKSVSFVINGRAFSGTGFGFNPSSGVPDAQDASGRPFALLPNPLFFQGTSAYSVFGGIGGGNTDYDAPDYQHMFMSWSVIGTSGLPQTILPSFHRPDLINYWSNQAAVSGNWLGHLDLLRQVMLRPMGQMSITPVGGTKVSLSTTTDHPNFTGSNPNFDAINGPWDVDNDGDGVPDSVWIDAGYPVQMRADGKLYKPLVAILCVDLDGRLNVNAAGTTEMLPPSSTYTQSTHSEQFVGATYSGSSPTSGNLPYVSGPFGGTDLHNNSNLQNQSFSLPRGEGLGPAENDLTQFYASILQEYSSPQLTATQAVNLANPISALLQQGGTINSVKYDGRYCDSSSTAPQAGIPNQPTLLGEVMRFQYPRNTFDPTANNIFPLSSFATPSDLWGRMAVGLDYRGQPLFWKPQWTNETKNDPYDMNLSMGGSYQAYGSVSADNPFGVFDLERMLRPFDVESGELPTRLWDLSAASSILKNPSTYQIPTSVVQTALLTLGRTITTDSWDTPSPSTISPDYLRAELGTLYGRKFAANIVEMMTARLLKENPAMTQTQVNTNIRQLLSPELIAGLRMNINRPLGDGRDGDNNNVVDEPTTGEIATEGNNSAVNKWSWLSSSLASVMPPPPKIDLVNGTDVNGDGVVDQKDQLLARQLLARHLYVLARLMLDDDFLVSPNNHWFDNEPTIGNDATPTGPKYEMSVRRIAQWAINVVDFMDPDNIMSPFEYDVNPFNGWQVMDGDPSTDEGGDRRLVWGCERPELLLNETLAFHDRRVMDADFDTDKSAFYDPSDPTKDSTYDQARIPQGSAFFELYCTGNVNQPQQSADLYTYDNTTSQWYLDLAKVSPQDALGNKYPVWRLAITGPDSNQKTTPSPNDVQTQITTYPASYSFDTSNGQANFKPSLVSGAGATAPATIERVILFTDTLPSTTATYDVPTNQIYYRHGGTNALLGCGQYAVVGPRQVTRIGWTTNPDPNAGSMYAAPGYEPACSKIELNPGSNGVLFADQTISATGHSAPITNYPDATMIRPPLAIITAADPPPAWSNPTASAVLDTKNMTRQLQPGIGISISEPLPGSNYYQEPTIARPAFDGEQAVTDCYGRLDKTDPTGMNIKFLDKPEDSKAGKPLYDNNALATQTYLNFKTVLLQRLANPLAPYNATSNPYLTVDWMPIDLTVFSGQAKPSSNADPDDPSPPSSTTASTSTSSIRFATRQRNGKLSGGISSLTSDFDIYYRGVQQQRGGKFLDAPTQTAGNDNTGSMVFPHQLKYFADPTHPSTSNLADAANGNANFSTAKSGLHSLGFVDSYFQQPLGVAFGQAVQTYGPLKALEVNNDPKHIGDPRSPFPWLVWNNRPYQSVSELMMVPASHPGRLLNEFSMFPTNSLGLPAQFDAYDYDVYDPNVPPPTPPNPPIQYPPPTFPPTTSAQSISFGHLLNFYSSTPAGSATPTGAGLSQIFEYLTVPSQFVGTQTVLNPQTFAWSGGTSGEQAMGGSEPNGTAGLHPPFNMVSNYREPGKVNINTITGEFDTTGKLNGAVWNAIIGGDPTATGSVATGPSFRDVALSRQGYLPPGASLSNTTLDASAFYRFDPAHPSIFSNPFRSGAGADMVPMTTLAHSPTNVTLYRAGKALGGANNKTLVAGTPQDTDNKLIAAGGVANTMPLMSNASDFATLLQQNPLQFQDATRNAYFAYQGLDHVTGKVTTHSNVYAVWITLGYFEVTPWYGSATATSGPQVFDTAHPDGYQLGAELGSDTGQIERHRAFYIIDRSIPVGYQHGLDNNVNNAVLLKRFIE